MNKKDKYIEDVNKRFTGKAKEIILNQIELFFKKTKNINKEKYRINEDVILEEGTFIHGIPGDIDNFDFVIENGFISVDFTESPKENKINNSVGFWKIKEKCSLKEYINLYSGNTITYNIGRGPTATKKYLLAPYHKFDEITETLNNDKEVWSYTAEQTKEVRFIPSLVSDKVQIAFILNMTSKYAKELQEADVWNINLDNETLKPFLDYRYYEKFLEERLNRNETTTDRESAIMFGLPNTLIEGVLIGRKIEKDQDKIKYIKQKLPNCYICNLEGKVIY